MSHLTDAEIDDYLEKCVNHPAMNAYERGTLYVGWEIVRALTRIAGLLEER